MIVTAAQAADLKCAIDRTQPCLGPGCLAWRWASPYQSYIGLDGAEVVSTANPAITTPGGAKPASTVGYCGFINDIAPPSGSRITGAGHRAPVTAGSHGERH
jgi:hypothetical protein